MIYFKWFLFAVLDILLLPTVVVAAPLVSLFTKEQPYGKAPYTWGWIWGTYDNPPQGDSGYVTKRSLFPNETSGIKGYINRTLWMIRNPLYGLAKQLSIEYDPSYIQVVTGNPSISDKYKIPGKYFVKLYSGKELIGFEFYGVFPWSSTRNLRVRLGWKISTDKFERNGFAQMVNTFNPFDGYGDD